MSHVVREQGGQLDTGIGEGAVEPRVEVRRRGPRCHESDSPADTGEATRVDRRAVGRAEVLHARLRSVDVLEVFVARLDSDAVLDLVSADPVVVGEALADAASDLDAPRDAVVELAVRARVEADARARAAAVRSDRDAVAEDHAGRRRVEDLPRATRHRMQGHFAVAALDEVADSAPSDAPRRHGGGVGVLDADALELRIRLLQRDGEVAARVAEPHAAVVQRVVLLASDGAQDAEARGVHGGASDVQVRREREVGIVVELPDLDLVGGDEVVVGVGLPRRSGCVVASAARADRLDDGRGH